MVCVIGGDYHKSGCSSLYMMMIDKSKYCKINFTPKPDSDPPAWTDDDKSDKHGPNFQIIETRFWGIFESLNGIK